MGIRFALALGLVCVAGGSAAQSHARTSEQAHSQASERSAQPDDAQHRRNALRAALQAQRGSAQATDATSPKQRQLSPEERAELRRQLRQQRREDAN